MSAVLKGEADQPDDADAQPAAESPAGLPGRAPDALSRPLWIAGLSLALAAPAAHLARTAPDPVTELVAGCGALLLALPALLYAARPLFASAWRDLRQAAPGADIPAALGIGVAFMASMAAAGGTGADTLALAIFLLLASRWLEQRVRARADGAPPRLAECAGRAQPPLARRAECVAAWLAPGAPLLAVLLFGAWWNVDPHHAWQVAGAVLLVACPRALALATPMALAGASERLLRCGVLAVRPTMLQNFDRVTHIVFDKTGILTHGRPVLHRTLPVGALDANSCLAIAAALEADNPHPLALAIRAAAELQEQAQQLAQQQAQQEAQQQAQQQALNPAQERRKGTPERVRARRVRAMPGMGVEGWIGERYYRLGSAAWVRGVASGAARAQAPAGTSSVWLGNSDGWLARLDLADSLRPEAAEVVRRFRAAGKTVLLLSGDEQGAAQSVAAQLGIPGALGGKLPHEKLEHVRRLRLGGAVVAIVGDGVKDAALLRAADVSFALARCGGSAQPQADCVLLGDGLLPLAEAADTARLTQAAVRQNLAWAAAYNALAIPAAALGLLAPWMAASGAAVASAVVVLNSLRLGRA